MKTILKYAFFIGMVMVGCKKTDRGVLPTPLPEPPTIPAATSSLSGVVSPAGSAKSVGANLLGGTGNTYYSVVPDPVTGAFQFQAMVPGSYSITVVPTEKYMYLAGFLATVPEKNNTDVGIVSLTAYPVICKINGVIDTWLPTTTYTSPNLSLSGSLLYGAYGQGNSVYHKLIIKLDDVNGIGTYTSKGTQNSFISYQTELFSSRTDGPTWSSAATGGSATLQITEIDAATKTITGTFTAVLAPASGGATGTKTLTEGTFKTTYK